MWVVSNSVSDSLTNIGVLQALVQGGHGDEGKQCEVSDGDLLASQVGFAVTSQLLLEDAKVPIDGFDCGLDGFWCDFVGHEDSEGRSAHVGEVLHDVVNFVGLLG